MPQTSLTSVSSVKGNAKPKVSSLGRLVFRCRVEQHLTQPEVAREVGVTAITISRLERGRTKPIRVVRERLRKFLKDHGYQVKSA